MWRIKLTKLEAINIILRALGENPLASLEVQYPTLDIAEPALEEARHELLIDGWWFNTRYEIELQPDVDGVVQLPGDAITFRPNDNAVTFEGTRLIDRNTGAAITGVAVPGRLITDIPFEQCPFIAQYVIAYSAAVHARLNDVGYDTNSQRLEGRVGVYLQQLGEEHIRATKFNSRKRASVRRWYSELRT